MPSLAIILIETNSGNGGFKSTKAASHAFEPDGLCTNELKTEHTDMMMINDTLPLNTVQMY